MTAASRNMDTQSSQFARLVRGIITAAYMGEYQTIATVFRGWHDKTAQTVACEIEERLRKHTYFNGDETVLKRTLPLLRPPVKRRALPLRPLSISNPDRYRDGAPNRACDDMRRASEGEHSVALNKHAFLLARGDLGLDRDEVERELRCAAEAERNCADSDVQVLTVRGAADRVQPG
jgi:hypothetical protein